VRAGEKVACHWQTLNGTRGFGKITELPNGSIWVGTQDKGVWRYTEETGWKPIPASLKYPSKNLGGFIPSPLGGVWVLGFSARIRVIDRPDLTDGWQVLEELSTWQGIPSSGITDLVEEPDGGLWLASSEGVVHLSPEARRARPDPPRVRLVDLIVNGERAALNATPRQVPPGDNQIEIHFAALTYRDRNLLKLQYRLHENDEWIDSLNKDPVFHFFKLGAGKYTVEVRASLDGVTWSADTARIDFEVLAHWYQRWWAIAVFALLIAAALYIAYRLRVGVLLKLERQRARIAMDLHDEIGSGLGSIGILSSVASSPNMDEGQRQDLTARIAETAGELGDSLTDIVWSLRSDATMLESLAYHMTRRAEGLFAAGAPRFVTEFPDDWQAVKLSLAARHNILLIAMESLHNAAKHSGAENVTLGFRRTSGRGWLMRIEDDGRGLPRGAGKNGAGMGIKSMKRRAGEIGAEIDWASNNGHGTIVSLKFDPQAKERG
jgi:signal transduction histidine kinase